MRLQSLFILLSCCALGLQAQNYKVSTEVQSKNVLLEECTGIRCVYCPEGHAKAEHLKQVLGDRISVVAIHCGHFAESMEGNLDFTVQAGLELGHLLGGRYGNFPNAAVNRRDWHGNGTYDYSRGAWIEYARKVVEEKTPVNLWGKAEIDAKTRQMKIHVEGYFTENVDGESPRLNILLAQNNVLGFQDGGYMGNKYPHQHMLRDAIGETLGQELEQHKQGEFFAKDYSYQLPEKYKTVDVDVTELELAVFVTHGQYDVLNAITVKPDYQGEVLPLRAVISPDKIAVGDGYSYDFVPLTLTNKCNTELKSVQFEVTLNGVTVESEWKGVLAPFATKEIRIPVDWKMETADKNTYRIAVKGLNGEAFDGNTLVGEFSAPVTLPSELVLRLKTNDLAAENTYTLYKADGEVVKSFGPFKNGEFQSFEEKLSLVPGETYCLEITDFWGDGVYAYGNAVELANEAGTVLLQQSTINDFGNRLFFKTAVPSGIQNMMTSESKATLYTTDGRMVRESVHGAMMDYSGLVPGIYILRTAKETKKITIK